jgi:DNA anti-recombination protein RmuC
LCLAEDDAIVVNGDEVKRLWRPVESDDARTAEGETMRSDLDKSGEGAETVGQKLDTLSASVDQRFDTMSASVNERFDTMTASVDERFDAVDVALVEQRQYTEFAFDRLDRRFDSVDARFNSVDSRLDSIDSRFNRLERKLDQFIDTQSTANKLVERRLTALEPRPAQE